MKKILLLATFALMGLVPVSKAATFTPPLDRRGSSLPSIDFWGAIPCSIDASTGTAAVLCGATGTVNLVYGVMTSSIGATDFLFFKDTTNPTNFSLVNSTVMSVNASGAGSNVSGSSTTQVFKFPVPVRFFNGIVIQAPAAPIGGRWTIFYRPVQE